MNEIVQENADVDVTLIEAFKVFLHYGYRKTSLDDVAQAVGVSRQTLYQRYKNKETLFKLSLETSLEDAILRCREAAAEDMPDVETKLFRIFDIWGGEYVEMLRASPHATEVLEASETLVGDLCEKKMDEFVEIVKDVLDEFGIPAMKDDRVSSQKVAETLHFTAGGLFHKAKDYDHFVEQIRTAIFIVCQI